FPATVFELVLSGSQKPYLWRVPFYTKKDKSIAKKAIETVNLSDLARKRISELSGGQRQRVLLARAICREPKLLVLDEPCAGLDKESSENFYGLLRKLNMENKTTIIMVSHDTLNIKKYAQRVIYLEKKVKFDGPTKVYFESRVAGNVV
ncbi:MAG: ATP-binding cassette domain-containing protein, partial [Clostridia bacterium]|nr:ATP-binding cassette domain-containing protein [Clostridia bacterium]